MSQLKLLNVSKSYLALRSSSSALAPLASWNDVDKRAMSGGALKEEHKRILDELKVAQEQFYLLNQEDADRIFQKVAQEANRHRLPLAKLAATETGMGCFEDKVLKNGLACELTYDRYRNSKTCGLIQGDSAHGTKVYAYPAVRFIIWLHLKDHRIHVSQHCLSSLSPLLGTDLCLDTRHKPYKYSYFKGTHELQDKKCNSISSSSTSFESNCRDHSYHP